MVYGIDIPGPIDNTDLIYHSPSIFCSHGNNKLKYSQSQIQSLSMDDYETLSEDLWNFLFGIYKVSGPVIPLYIPHPLNESISSKVDLINVVDGGGDGDVNDKLANSVNQLKVDQDLVDEAGLNESNSLTNLLRLSNGGDGDLSPQIIPIFVSYSNC